MDKERFDKALEMHRVIEHYKDLLKRTEHGNPSCGLELKCKTGYSDMGMDFTCNMELKDDIALDVWRIVRKHIQSKIDELTKEFEKL